MQFASAALSAATLLITSAMAPAGAQTQARPRTTGKPRAFSTPTPTPAPTPTPTPEPTPGPGNIWIEGRLLDKAGAPLANEDVCAFPLDRSGKTKLLWNINSSGGLKIAYPCGTARSDGGFRIEVVKHKDLAWPDGSGTVSLAFGIPPTDLSGATRFLRVGGANVALVLKEEDSIAKLGDIVVE